MSNIPPQEKAPEPMPTVLVVEDEPLIRFVLLDMLEDRGFRVLEAASADVAINVIEQSEVEIDLVFTDVRMPGSMDGIGLVRWIQSFRPELPVLVASGDIGAHNHGKDALLGVIFISKPYHLRTVEAKVRQAIALRIPRTPDAPLI